MQIFEVKSKDWRQPPKKKPPAPILKMDKSKFSAKDWRQPAKKSRLPPA
jgi:hypothetical protein